MLDRTVDSALAALLLALSLSFHAFSAILSQLHPFVPPPLLSGPLRRASRSRFASLELQVGEEFAFERAIEAYEGVIDAASAQRRA